MNIQFNLLPDVKQEYIKAQKAKQTVTTIAFALSGLFVVILLLMMSMVYGVNKKQLRDADGRVKELSNQIKDEDNLDRILTVQNQLVSLPNLHSQKHISSKIFDYLPQITPAQVNLGRLTIDFSTNSMEISGTADSQKTINTFIDTLKFTTYKQDDKDTGKKAFPSVIEKNFGFEKQGVSYILSVEFDPALFSNQQNIALNVPAGLATTRSVLNDPSNVIFNGVTGTPPSTNGQAPSTAPNPAGTSTTPSSTTTTNGGRR